MNRTLTVYLPTGRTIFYTGSEYYWEFYENNFLIYRRDLEDLEAPGDEIAVYSAAIPYAIFKEIP